jgi:Pyruvate phosphate dikinase, AMP/ATP-binding domain
MTQKLHEAGDRRPRWFCDQRGGLTYVLDDAEILKLARRAVAIEQHYGRSMDKWAKDGATGDLYIVQARPETIQARRAVAEVLRAGGRARLLMDLLTVDEEAMGRTRLLRCEHGGGGRVDGGDGAGTVGQRHRLAWRPSGPGGPNAIQGCGPDVSIVGG